MAGQDQHIDTEALIAHLAQLEQEMAQRDALPQATRHYNQPANYYEHRSPILPPPLERRDSEIKTSTINQMTQHQFCGLQGEHPINHNEERNQQRQQFKPGSIGFALAAEHKRDMSYISNRWSQQRYEYQPGSIGFELSLDQEIQNQSPNAFQPRQRQGYQPDSLGWYKNNAQGLQNQSPTTNDFQPRQQPFAPAQTTSDFQARQQSFIPSAPFQPTHSAEPQDKLETLLQQLILKQQKTNEKLDSMYANLNGKFESLSSHVKSLSLQADQNAEWVGQQQIEQEPTEDSSRLVIPTTTEADHKPRIEQEEGTTSTDTLEQQPDSEAPCQSVSKGNELFSTHLMEKLAESPIPASKETPGQQDATNITIKSRSAAEAVEPPKSIYDPPSGTSLLKTSQKKDDPEVFNGPCPIQGVKFEGSTCRTSAFQRSCPPSPPRRPFPRRIPRSPKVHPPDTGVRIMMVARIHHQQLLYAKYSGVDGEDPWTNSQAN